MFMGETMGCSDYHIDVQVSDDALNFASSLQTEKEIKDAIGINTFRLGQRLNEIEATEVEVDRSLHFVQVLKKIQAKIALIDIELGLSLRINQLKAIQDLIDFLSNDGFGDKVGYFHQPTGAGKTILMGLLLYLCSEKGLVLVPNTNLLKQTKDEYVDLLGIDANDVGLVGGDYEELGRKFTICTYRSLQKLVDNGGCAGLDMLILDEVHMGLGDVTQDTLDTVDEEEMHDTIDSYVPKNAFKFGFTATPDLRRKKVKDYLPVMISRVYMADLVDAGILTPFKFVHVEGQITNEEYQLNDFSIDQEVEILEREEIYEKLIQKMLEVQKEINERLLPMVCCANHQECFRFVEVAKSYGLEGAVIVSGSSDEDLEQAQNDLEEGKIDFIATVRKLEAGWNWKKLNAVVFARSTKSPVKLIQPAGRSSRALEGKNYAYIFETDWKVAFSVGGDGETHTGNGGGWTQGTGVSQRAFKRKPLSLMTALQLTGERDLHRVGVSINGEPLSFDKEYFPDENGVILAEIDGREIEVVLLSPYATANNLFYQPLRDAVENAGVLPCSNIAGRSGPHLMPVFLKSEVDNVLPRTIGEDGIGVGVINGESVEVINTELYAVNTLKTKTVTLRGLITEAGLAPVTSGMFFNEDGQRLKAIYVKSEVDALLPKKLDEGGVVTIQVDGNPVEVVGLSRYAQNTLKMKPETLKRRVTNEGLTPIEGANVYGGRLPVEVYEKEKVDTIVKPLTIDAQGCVTLNLDGESFVAVNINNYIKSVGVSRKAFAGALDNLNISLEVVSDVKVCAANGSTQVDVVRKTDIDKVLRRIFNKEGEASIEIDDEVVEVLQIDLACKHLGLSKKEVRKQLDAGGCSEYTEFNFIKGTKLASGVYLKEDFQSVVN